MSALRGKHIVLGVTGGIAAYKAAELCRLLVKQEAVVRVVMTAGAEAFVTALTLQTLSGHKVGRHLLDASEEAEIGHIRLADACDLVLVAPTTADALARFAGGHAGDLLSAVVLATKAPVLLAPAMNVNMWQNPLTQANLATLTGTGRFSTVGPETGDLACGWVGAGRMAEPLDLVQAVVEKLQRCNSLAHHKVVITAGPTHEPVDEVRFLGNRSSGKMGFALAEAAAARGAEVVLVAGPVSLATPGRVNRVNVQTALQMQAAVNEAVVGAHTVIMTAAVADFRPREAVSGKLSRRQGVPPLELVANPDILAELAASRNGQTSPRLIGFAAEFAPSDADLIASAQRKIAEKRCDAIIANNVGNPAIGFSSDQNAGWLVLAQGPVVELPLAPKRDFAEAIWDNLLRKPA